MIHSPLNLSVISGTTFKKTVTIKNSDGTIVNLTGYALTTSLKRHFGSGESFILTTTINSASSGTIDLSITSTETTKMKSGRYFFSVSALVNSVSVLLLSGEVSVTNQ